MRNVLTAAVKLAVVTWVVATCVPLAGCGNHAFAMSTSRSQLIDHVDNAETVVVALVVDTTGVRRPSGIYTEYSLAVEEVLKGHADSVYSVGQLGGRVGARRTVNPAAAPLMIGKRYVLLLNRCVDLPWPLVVARESRAELDGETGTRFSLPPRTINATAYLDSVRSLARNCTPRRQAMYASLVVRGTVTAMDVGAPGDVRMQEGFLRIAVQSVALQTAGPAVSAGDTVIAAMHRTDGRDGAFVGSSPRLREAEPAYFFLDRSDTQWTLRPTLYSLWRIRGSDVVVETMESPCEGSDPVISRIPVTAFLDSIDGR